MEISLFDPDHFWGKVDRAPEGCWEWQRGKTGCGYGAYHIQRRVVLAHRVSYELSVGPIPEGLQLDHLCRNRACVNPDHLEPVTGYENQHRSPLTSAGKTHCPQGHPYDEENTYVAKRGDRHCRECSRQRTREWKRRRKAEVA